MTLPRSDKWLAASVRASFFCATPINPEAGLFEAITRRKPEAIHQQPQHGQCMEVGSPGTGVGQLLVQTAINRIDIIRQGIPSFGESLIPTLGPAIEAVNEVSELASSWLRRQQVPTVLRVALGCTAFAKSESYAAASEIAMTVLPQMDLDFGQIEDLLVQFNIPTQSSAVEGLRVNRLSKVGAVAVETMSIGPSDSAPIVNRGFAAQYELDVNTDAARSDPIQSDCLANLMEELASHIKKAYSGASLPEIARSGSSK